MRVPLIRFLVQQREALFALSAFARACVQRQPNSVFDDTGAGTPFARSVTRGDVLVTLGGPWSHPNYAGVVERARRDHGIRFALLVYDVIPLYRPEWCETALTRVFPAFMNAVLPIADRILTISRSSAADILRHAEASGLSLRATPVVVPVGTGFRKPATSGVAGPAPVLPSGPYVLVVGTVEVRKNHLLLFHIWRRLLADMPSAAVPTLVIAGRIGWLVDDLMGQLRNCDWLGGRIVLIEDVSDTDLARLYDGCLFTVFPSFYEGWGLPVSESLGFGCPCIASSWTSLPEAGGDLARYFDPSDAPQAYAVIREAIDRPDAVREWRARIASSYRPVSWSETATALVDAVDSLPG